MPSFECEELPYTMGWRPGAEFPHPSQVEGEAAVPLHSVFVSVLFPLISKPDLRLPWIATS